MMRSLLKCLTVSMIAMILLVNTTTVFASDDNEPKFPDSVDPPVEIVYLMN